MEEKYMNLAIKEAKKAYNIGEIPVGAVIVYKDRVIAKAYNQKEKMNNATKHAEIIAIEKASKKLNNWRLENCSIYITLEPCPMCASAIKQARISCVYAGISSNDKENINIVKKIFNSNYNNAKVNYMCKNDNLEIKKLLKEFFLKKRTK